ncbi:putative beta-1,4-mannosyl-glycoprotein 4-beta-N-acetylglucosaminyltransferase [Helianthus anomalus]
MTRICCLMQTLDIRTFIVLFLVIPIGFVCVYFHGQTITYFLRPLWQSPPKPFIPIPHFYHENVSMASICKLHGWEVRDYPRKVYDAVLFNNEVDMLTIRWKELDPYITQFVLLESNSTFTSIPKPHYFAINRERFDFVEPRLTYGTIGGRFKKGENPFVEEAYQRVALDHLLKIAGIEEGDLLIMSDVDEIPSAHTVDLLRWCEGPPAIVHLNLKNYLYSFEFNVAHTSWRASVHHFCFRKISDFVFKMKAYSHTDRVRFAHFLDPKRIQKVICNGDDLYDMLPEEYTFKDIIARMGPIPHSYSAVHLPSYLLNHADQYSYLLPGHCIREAG